MLIVFLALRCQLAGLGWFCCFASLSKHSTALSEHSQCVLSNAVNLKVGINEGGKKVLQNRRGHMREKELRRILLLCGSCPSWCAVDRQDFSLLAFSPKDSSRCAKKAGIKHFNRYFLRSIYPFIPLQYILI